MNRVPEAVSGPLNSKVSAVQPTQENRPLKDEQNNADAEINFRKQLNQVVSSYSEHEAMKEVNIRIVEQTSGALFVELNKKDGEHLATIKADAFIKSHNAATRPGLLVNYFC